MSVKIKKLIEILKDKNPDDLVEFVVARTDGTIVTMDLCATANDMANVVKLFGPKKK